MRRLRPSTRPSPLVLLLLAAGVAALVVGIALHGTVAQANGGPRDDATHTVDYVKVALTYGGPVLVLASLLRWYTAAERAPEEDEGRRSFGQSITDVRTDQDPLVGMRPLRTPDR
jgi:hypothetical protein